MLRFGYALLPIFRRDKQLTDRPVSSLVARVEGNAIKLCGRGGVTGKIGVAPQDIVAGIARYRCTLRRGKMGGMSATQYDLGMLTQVFVGSAKSALIEIEQLTPFGGKGLAVSEIVVEPVVHDPAR